MGIACVGTNAEEYLDKVKFIKLFIENLVYAFFFRRWFVLRDGLSMFLKSKRETMIATRATILAVIGTDVVQYRAFVLGKVRFLLNWHHSKMYY
jgi:hypothetical protein